MYWPATDGVGSSKYNGNSFGIPNSEPLWKKNYGDQGTYLDPMISYGDFLVHAPGKVGNSNKLLFIDVNTGDVVEEIDGLNTDKITINMSATQEDVVVGNHLLSSNGKAELQNLYDCIDDEFSAGSIFWLGDQYIWAPINARVMPGKYFVFNIATRKSSIQDMPISSGLIVPGQDIIYGRYQDAHGIQSIVCYSIEEGLIWKKDNVPFAPMMAHQELMSIAPEKVSLYSKATGELIKTLSSASGKFDMATLASNRKSYSDDGFQVLSNRTLYAYCINHDKEIFRLENMDISDYCIAGDAVFVIRELKGLAAFDRYDGSLLWESESGFGWSNIIASNDKLFVYCSTGDIICFDCGTPYVSPNRHI